jgi:hypothetical protein
MKNKDILNNALNEGIVDKVQHQKLLEMFEKLSPKGNALSLSNVLYYFGGFVAIFAVTIFMNVSYQAYEETGLLTISLALFCISIVLSKKYSNIDNHIPSGIFSTFCICLVPLIIHCVQVLLGTMEHEYREYHRYVQSNWIYMEFGTLLVALIMFLKVNRAPFMMLPIALTLWYMSMDLTLFTMKREYYSPELRKTVSIVFGLVMIFFAMYIDSKSNRSTDYPYWLYMSGTLSFWIGLTSISYDNEIWKLTCLVINLAMIGLGVIISRKVLVSLGSIGSVLYFGYLTIKFSNNPLTLSLAAIFVGFIIMKIGMYWNRNEDRIIAKINIYLPAKISNLITIIKR